MPQLLTIRLLTNNKLFKKYEKVPQNQLADYH